MSNGKRLEEERNKTKLTQEVFGAVAGVSEKEQASYEKDERYPDMKYLQNISELGCDIQYIVIGVKSINMPYLIVSDKQ